MIPSENKTVHHVGNVIDEIAMTVDSTRAGQAHLMRVLRRDLYSNGKLATIRELATNALDSNVEAGNTGPINVTLPTTVHPQLVVADQGMGLSVDDIRDVYSVFGASTKRTNNDVTGTLGFGCKAPLAYSLSFTLDAVKGGVRTLALVTVDEQDVGTIKVLDTSATDAPNGVTVTVPVKAHDVAEFCNLARDLFSYWKPGTVLVDGEQPAGVSVSLMIDEDMGIVRGIPGASRLVMGGVSYPFNVTGQFNHGIVAWIPMGSVDFTPAREALQMTELTKSTIKDVLEFAKERLGVKILEAIRAAETPFEKAKVLAGWRYEQLMTKAQAAELKTYKVALSIKLPSREAWQHNGYNYGSNKHTVQKAGVITVYVDGRHVRETNQLRWDAIVDDRPIVTGFPFSGVSRNHRYHLVTYFGAGRSYLLIPEDAVGTEVLEGRPNVHEWKDLVEAAPLPARVKGQKAPRLQTVYQAFQGGQAFEATDFDDKTPIVMCIDVPLPRDYETKYPTARFVSLMDRQVNKFKRLFPTAVQCWEYESDEKRKALESLTDDDKLVVHAPASGLGFLVGHEAELLDEELRCVVLATKRTSTRANRCVTLGLAIPQPPIFAQLAKRYPLIGKVTDWSRQQLVNDLLLYVQSKFLLLEDAAQADPAVDAA